MIKKHKFSTLVSQRSKTIRFKQTKLNLITLNKYFSEWIIDLFLRKINNDFSKNARCCLTTEFMCIKKSTICSITNVGNKRETMSAVV